MNLSRCREAANKCGLQLLRGLGGEMSQKSPAPSPPACQQLPPRQWGRALGSSPRWKRLSPHLKHWALFLLFLKGSFGLSEIFTVPAIIHFSAGVRRGGQSSSVQGQGRDTQRAFGCAGGTNGGCRSCPERPGCGHSHGDLPAEQFAGRSHGKAPSPRPHHGLAHGQGMAKLVNESHCSN